MADARMLLVGDRRKAALRSSLPWVLFALVLVVAPLVFGSSLGLNVLSQMGIAIIVCLSYNLLFGQGGMLSFGHAVYSGVGAFSAIHVLKAVGAGQLALPVSVVPLAGGLASGLLALLLGWVTTRKSGTTFAMITLGVGELVWAIAQMFPGWFGGEGGISANRVVEGTPFGLFPGLTFGPQMQVYGLIALYTFVCTALMYAFTRTPLGRMLNAVRDNAERAGFVGYDTQKVRYLSFVIAAFFAGIGGGLAALNFEIVTTDVLSSYRSGAYLLFTFVGGATFFIGPIIGGVLMVLAFVLLSTVTKAWLLYLGLLFLVMVMYAPGGLASVLVANLRMAAHGQWRRLAGPYVWLALSVLLTGAGAAALIEMLYHLQLGAALGPSFRFVGVTLDTGAATHWVAAASLASVGAGLLAWTQPRFAVVWRAIQADMAAPCRQPLRGDS